MGNFDPSLKNITYSLFIQSLQLLVGSVFFFSCTQELNIPFPRGQEQLVLNSILNPDSTIKVSLTKTLPLGTISSDFPVVTNAEIRLYEDDVLIGHPVFQDSIYVLDYQPLAGKEYSIVAEVPGHATLRAADTMPRPASVFSCVEPSDKYNVGWISYNAVRHIHVDDAVGIRNNYWFFKNNVIYSYGNCNQPNGRPIKSEPCKESISFNNDFYYSFSSVPDRFNSYVDSYSGGVTVYELFIRVEDAILDGKRIHFDIPEYYYENHTDSIQWQSSDPDHKGKAYLVTLNASTEYDKYLKSQVVSALSSKSYPDNDNWLAPFSEITQTYSNVENGTGIFATYNSTTIPLGNSLCE